MNPKQTQSDTTQLPHTILRNWKTLDKKELKKMCKREEHSNEEENQETE
jgi:hypothetical protein